MDIETAREEYKKIRSRSQAEDSKVFDSAVSALIAKRNITKPTADDYLAAARAVTFKCRRCAGTGRFITMVENGQPKGPGGACYRCGGKGFQNDDDARRNYGADMHRKVY